MRPSETGPELVLVAGPNGGGKSWLYSVSHLNGVFVNADDVAKTINPNNPEAAALAAGRVVVARLSEAIEARRDVVYETTLSSHQSLNVMKRARQNSYRILLIFVILASADFHIARVRQRVRLGGHFIPETTIRRRYALCFDQLALAVPLCDVLIVYDNTGSAPRRILEIQSGRLVSSTLNNAVFLDRRIEAAVRTGLGVLAMPLFVP